MIAVVGELTAENFALEDRVLQEIREQVQVIFHSAATIKFNEDLKHAIEINVLGTKRTLELAKSLQHLASYVYLSTAFCNSNYRGLIKEKVYSSGHDPADMISRAQRNEFPLSSHDPKTKAIIGRHPNTYTFTKQLAETMILNEMRGLPVGIVRPSVGMKRNIMSDGKDKKSKCIFFQYMGHTTDQFMVGLVMRTQAT